jgi:hypothetical protein
MMKKRQLRGKSEQVDWKLFLSGDSGNGTDSTE